MFGAVNALFTALAFAGLIYTVLLQRDQLALQQQEILESGKTQEQLVQRQIDAQKQLFDQQTEFQNRQRKLQEQHGIKLEQLRQDFEELVEKQRKDRQIADENAFRRNVLRAIRFELDALGELYDNAIGKDLANVPDGTPLRTRFAFSQNFFSVFEANAVHLGRIDAIKSKHIVKTYALLKSLVENFRINNEYLDQYEALTSEMEEQPAAGSDRVHSMVEHVARRMRFAPRVADVERWMIRHAAILKDIEKNLKTEVAALGGALDQDGI